MTLVEALKAADELSASGINIRVVDPFTIKPLDVDTIVQSAHLTGGRIVVAEDHYPEGTVRPEHLKNFVSGPICLTICVSVLHDGSATVILFVNFPAVAIDAVKIGHRVECANSNLNPRLILKIELQQ